MPFDNDVAGGVEELTTDVKELTGNSAWTGLGETVAGPAERDAVAALILCEMPFLERIVRRWHRNRPDAEDLLQETILRLLTNAHAWQPGTNFRAWAFTVMRNQFRANWKRTRHEAEIIAEMELNGPVEAEDNCLERLTVRDVQCGLRRLSPSQRETIVLVGVEGQSYQAAASAMGISVAAVRCHLARARERLRAAVLEAEDASPCSSRPPVSPGPVPCAKRGRPALRPRVAPLPELQPA